MSYSEQASRASWRDKDYSNVQERYFFKPRKPGFPISGWVYIVMAAISGYGLIGIAFFFAARHGLLRKSFFVTIYMVVILLIGAIAFASFSPNTTITHEDATLMRLSLLYAIVLLYVGLKALKEPPFHPSMNAPVSGDDPQVPQQFVLYKNFGTIGDLSSAKGKFSDENIAKGEAGEKLTAELLDDLLRIPGTRIFHGLKWPGSTFADIDHIVVNGSRIALIDSKLWTGQKHMFTSQGTILTFAYDGKSFTRKMSFGAAVDKFRSSLNSHGFTRVKCHGWLAIHNAQGGKALVDNKYNPNLPITLADAKDAVDQVGDWLAEAADGTIYVELFQNILSRVK